MADGCPGPVADGSGSPDADGPLPPPTSERERAVQRVLTALARGAAVGGGLRGGLALFALLSRRRKAGSGAATQAVVTALRYAAFVGVFAGGYTAVDELLASAFGRACSRWRAAAAGAAAAPALLLTGDGPHTSLALYVLVRAAVLAVRCGLKSESPWLRLALRPARARHGDVAIMVASSAQILYAWIVWPSTLPASYVAFLDRHGGRLRGPARRALRSLVGGGVSAEELNAELKAAEVSLAALWGRAVDLTSPGLESMQQVQSILVPGSAQSPPGLPGLPRFLAGFLPVALGRALWVYVPLYFAPAVAVHRGRLLRSPGRLLSKAAAGTLRSATFLAMYCAGAVTGATVMTRLAGPTTAALVSGAGLSGLAVLIEKKSRRMELAMYCLSRAVESAGLCLLARGWVRGTWARGRWDVAAFAVAAATIMHCYAFERDVFRSKYLNVLDWVCGNEGHEKQRITHVTSIAALAALVRPPAESGEGGEKLGRGGKGPPPGG